jgi:hypothetical protein
LRSCLRHTDAASPATPAASGAGSSSASIPLPLHQLVQSARHLHGPPGDRFLCVRDWLCRRRLRRPAVPQGGRPRHYGAEQQDDRRPHGGHPRHPGGRVSAGLQRGASQVRCLGGQGGRPPVRQAGAGAGQRRQRQLPEGRGQRVGRRHLHHSAGLLSHRALRKQPVPAHRQPAPDRVQLQHDQDTGEREQSSRCVHARTRPVGHRACSCNSVARRL